MKENLGRFSSPTTEIEAKMKDFRVSQAGFKGGIRMRKLSLGQEEEEILGLLDGRKGLDQIKKRFLALQHNSGRQC